MSAAESARLPPPPLFCLRDTHPVHVVRFLSDSLLATGNEDGCVKLWNLNTRRTVRELAVSSSSVLQVQRVSGFDNAALIQSRDGGVGIWDVDQGKVLWKVHTDAYGFCRGAVATSSSSPRIIVASPTAGKDRSIVLWDMQGGVPIQTIKDPSPVECMVMHCAFVKDDTAVACCFEDGSLSIWDRRAARWLIQGTVVHQGEGGMLLRFAFDRKMRVGVGAGTHQLVVVTVDAEKSDAGQDLSLSIKHTMEMPTRGLSDIAVRSDDKLFGTGGWDHRVRIFSLQKAVKPLAVLEYHSGVVHAIDFAPENIGSFATGSDDHRVALWSLYPSK